MTVYFRIGNQTVTSQQAQALTPAEIENIKDDANRAEQKRQENLAASVGLNTKAVSKNIVADIRPGSDLHKAIIEDKIAAAQAVKSEIVGTSAVQESNTSPKKKRGRPAKKAENKVETVTVQA